MPLRGGSGAIPGFPIPKPWPDRGGDDHEEEEDVPGHPGRQRMELRMETRADKSPQQNLVAEAILSTSMSKESKREEKPQRCFMRRGCKPSPGIWCPCAPQGVAMSCRMFLWLLLALSVCAHPGTGVSSAVSPAVLPRHMDSVLDILDALESPARGGSPGTAAALGRGLGVCSTPGCRAVLGEPPGTPERPPALTPGQWQLLTELLHHDPTTPELGAVLVPDGSTVALCPLLAGIEVGLRSGGFGRPLPTLDPPADPFLAVTITEALGTSFLLAQGCDNNATVLGPGGCWDNMENPQNYTLRGPPSPVPDPVAIGAMDGVILGVRLAQGPLPVAELLRGYYGTGNGSEARRPPSSYRRRKFGALAGQERLEKEVAATLELLRTLSPTSELLRDVGTQEVVAVARRAAREFSERYVECPAIMPRCLWGAHPYRGTPAPLQPPLGSVFLHHTLEPSRPCQTFSACARAMRDMQRFHQDTRGWDDIGYSFVVGSDGYLYEGRGWHWVGAHTKGYNTQGFGVGIVGDFTATLPDPDTLALVRDELLPCAVRFGHIRPDFSLRGHRQLGHTDCPGDALFQEIQSWPGFQGTPVEQGLG
ncbi:N-acetylmuramoyl-L-alanine amidase-like isoform X4 [Haemorhous mexicanus]|uniref:N-acetylmuramoyl-L-alanine amidase-like isoform X4 n=1 Tax=Haemorhous mexicanus TaxID=30427 RepID=UPI0028BE6198|nr:N-acetylmuramoyl-L-alanine amidase-like isoform X4 [Haemorhous mexicanus]